VPPSAQRPAGHARSGSARSAPDDGGNIEFQFSHASQKKRFGTTKKTKSSAPWYWPFT